MTVSLCDLSRATLSVGEKDEEAADDILDRQMQLRRDHFMLGDLHNFPLRSSSGDKVAVIWLRSLPCYNFPLVYKIMGR